MKFDSISKLKPTWKTYHNEEKVEIKNLSF